VRWDRSLAGLSVSAASIGAPAAYRWAAGAIIPDGRRSSQVERWFFRVGGGDAHSKFRIFGGGRRKGGFDCALFRTLHDVPSNGAGVSGTSADFQQRGTWAPTRDIEAFFRA